MKTGFIGFGNMASAIAGGMIRHGGHAAGDIIVSARDFEKLEMKARGMGVATRRDNISVAREADILFLAVKPYLILDVIREVREAVRKDAVIISIALGVPVDAMEEAFGQPMKIIRAMPNTPALVGQGMTIYNISQGVTSEEEANVLDLFTSFGIAQRVEDSQFPGAGSLTGCSPAFVYMLLEAMADAAVHQGTRRDQAYRLAAQTVKGAAEMLLSTGLHPGELKDQVTSPGGTTIEGVRTLEQLGFRSAIMEAIIAASEKTRGN